MGSPLLGDRTRRRLSFLINFAFWALWAVLLLATGRALIRWLLPFVAAFVIASLLQRPLAYLERRFAFTHGFAATAVSTLTLTVTGGGAAVLFWRGGAVLFRLLSTERTVQALQTCGERLQQFADTLSARLSVLPADLSEVAVQAVHAAREAITESGAAYLASFSAKLLAFATDSLPRLLLAAFFFALALVFFTRDYNTVTAFLMRQIPAPQKPLVKAAATALKDTAASTVKAYVLLGAVTAAETAVGFWLLKLPFPLVWAVVTALVDALPVLGVGTVLFPLATVYFIGGNPVRGIGTLALYAIATASHHLLQPRFLSRETGLPPLITLLTMYAGWRAAGVFGLLAAPVFAMVLLRLQAEGHLRIFR